MVLFEAINRNRQRRFQTGGRGGLKTACLTVVFTTAKSVCPPRSAPHRFDNGSAQFKTAFQFVLNPAMLSRPRPESEKYFHTSQEAESHPKPH